MTRPRCSDGQHNDGCTTPQLANAGMHQYPGAGMHRNGRGTPSQEAFSERPTCCLQISHSQ